MEVNPESRLSLQDKKEEIYMKAPSPTQETHAIYPTSDSMVWPFVLKTQLSKQSGVGKKSIVNDGEKSCAERLRLQVLNENFNWKDDRDLQLRRTPAPLALLVPDVLEKKAERKGC